MPDLLLLLKIKYNKHLQDREDKKDTKASLGSYKHHWYDFSSINELISSPLRQHRQ